MNKTTPIQPNAGVINACCAPDRAGAAERCAKHRHMTKDDFQWGEKLASPLLFQGSLANRSHDIMRLTCQHLSKPQDSCRRTWLLRYTAPFGAAATNTGQTARTPGDKAETAPEGDISCLQTTEHEQESAGEQREEEDARLQHQQRFRNATLVTT